MRAKSLVSRKAQLSTLARSTTLIAPAGRVSVAENGSAGVAQQDAQRGRGVEAGRRRGYRPGSAAPVMPYSEWMAGRAEAFLQRGVQFLRIISRRRPFMPPVSSTVHAPQLGPAA